MHKPSFVLMCSLFVSLILILASWCVFAEDLNRLKEKLTETTQVKMELQFKLDDIQSSEASVQVCYRFVLLDEEEIIKMI